MSAKVECAGCGFMTITPYKAVRKERDRQYPVEVCHLCASTSHGTALLYPSIRTDEQREIFAAMNLNANLLASVLVGETKWNRLIEQGVSE
jgi:Fe-S-cluster-containing dehydrogenase component